MESGTAEDARLLSPLPLDYAQLKRFVERRAIPPRHESAAKRAIWDLTLGLAHIRCAAECPSAFQAIQNTTVKLKIWKYLDLPLEVELPLSIASPATSEGGWNLKCTAKNLVAGTNVWATKNTYPTSMVAMCSANREQEESIVLEIPLGSIVTGFSIASLKVEHYRSIEQSQMRIEEIMTDGTVGAELFAWSTCGTCVPIMEPCEPSSVYTPLSHAATTTATRFKVSVRSRWTRSITETVRSGNFPYAGVALFDVVGVVAPPLPPRPPLNYEQLEHFTAHGCAEPQHESAVRRAIWNLTLGLAHIRGAGESTFVFQALQNTTVKLKIWKYMTLPLAVQLHVDAKVSDSASSSALSEINTTNTVVNMLAGKHLWATACIRPGGTRSVIFEVAPGSRVVKLEFATPREHGGDAMQQMRIEAMNPDGTVGATLLPWNHYGTLSMNGMQHHLPMNYVPELLSVHTTTTRVKVSVRHGDYTDAMPAGLAVFRVIGVAGPAEPPPPLPSARVPDAVGAAGLTLADLE